jgi:citrate lyase beta subunit
MALTAAALGATLYVPATRADLAEALLQGRHPDLRSAIICLEDSVRPDQTSAAMQSLGRFLSRLAQTSPTAARPALFVRPRSAAMLRLIIQLPGAERLDGFVVPKATADALPAYVEAAPDRRQWLMPTVETRAAFDPAELQRLRRCLTLVQDRVLAVRIGGNDLLQLLNARRSTRRTAYDGPLGSVITSLVCAFAPFGFALSAPVLESYGVPALLQEEVERDLEHGLVTKTVIHPAQIAVVHAAYAVGADELAAAHATLSGQARAVFARGGVMSEPATHARWALTVLERARHFGVVDHLAEAPARAQAR